MSRNDGFLARWSRRKLDASAATAETPARPGPDGTETLPSGPAGAPQALEVELSEEELSALPRLEDLTAETDLAPFLRAGVPALLRKAALRRMWSIDPAIRDFVGEARDYSYDWNVAGGVPVSGPLLPGYDVQATLGRMFSRIRDDAGSEGVPDEDAGPTSTADAAPIPDPAERPSTLDRTTDGDVPAVPAGDGRPESPNLLARDFAAAAAVGSAEAGGPPEPAGTMVAGVTSQFPPRRRRHGAARPKLD
ncbi:DUF3306 domain-containing protein [uncultured Enterovirga sp.]|uniref:DUF3306 domain-containing protein n=1 Tax=uncultured Enterovirga sp. TaxID=2026352 RepID=UPI0035C9CB4C